MIYEILIRGRVDGTVAGAHVIEYVPDGTGADGQPRYRVSDAATPVEVADVADLIGTQSAAMLAQIAALESEVAALKSAAPAAPAPPSMPPGITYKSDLWRRATDAEAAAIDAYLDTLSAKDRRLFESVTYLDPAATDYDRVRAAFVAAFGADRAAELLAPSA